MVMAADTPGIQGPLEMMWQARALPQKMLVFLLDLWVMMEVVRCTAWAVNPEEFQRAATGLGPKGALSVGRMQVCTPGALGPWWTMPLTILVTAGAT